VRGVAMALVPAVRREAGRRVLIQLRTSIVARLALSGALAVLVAACGPLGDDNEKTTPTAEVNEAQPTAAVSESPAAATPRTSAPTNTDMSTMAGASTPVASPIAVATPASVMATPAEGVTVATPAASGPVQAGATTGDGTTGPVVSSGTPSASPAASPAAEAGVVTSCAPDVVPPFSGETTAYVVVEDLNFRVGPGTGCESIGEGPLAAGTAVTVVGGPVVRQGEEDLQWLQVDVGGVVGWVAADFVSPAQ
jgi:hypothetical protein